MVGFKQNVKSLKAMRDKRMQEKEMDEWLDITHPAHNQGKKFQIESDHLLQLRAEPPAKNAAGSNGEDATLQEDEGKAKELAEAKAASAQLEAQKKAEAEAAAAAAAAAEAAKAAKEKEEEIKRNTRPDGTIHMNGVRQFPDGQVVGGVNLC